MLVVAPESTGATTVNRSAAGSIFYDDNFQGDVNEYR